MGGCVSFPHQRSKDLGISSLSLKQNQNKQGTRFHNGSPNENYSNARKAKVLKRPKKIHKGIIGLPSNFQHTGHIGIAEMRSGRVDPEKIKIQMAEVAAALRLEIVNDTGSIPSTPRSEPKLLFTDAPNGFSSSVTSSPTSDSSLQQFHIKRKPTLTPVSSPSPRPTTPTALQQTKIDPMAEVIAAMKMPIDGNFNTRNKFNSDAVNSGVVKVA
ncbi:11668_t:CDS:2 [Cetraspora pellucida]|uniref:11668_t:CDS:1 n=1 Tax=Cetraspora pellucida TaxID=1433469 RepID=A0ACA9N3Z2_9GLOM|nr:11668_t:CDS:2 [Cetraspora pellucida]